MKRLSESDIIEQYFVQQVELSNAVALGIGDDAALLDIPIGKQLVTSIDTLHQGTHFFKDVHPFDLGYKSLAVSVSDIAAMGAEPFSALLSLSLPQVEPDWLQAFREGLFALAKQFSIQLAGGDLTQGPLSVTTVVNGLVPSAKALQRNRAKAGDLIYVSGTLGDAGLALQFLQQQQNIDNDFLLSRLLRPTPRVTLGCALRDLASSAMDISDGLLLDLSKLCQASGVAAELERDKLPLSPALQQHCAMAEAYHLALSAGDDYELLFTVPADYQAKLSTLALDVSLTCVGRIASGSGVEVVDKNHHVVAIEKTGYDHFL